MEDYTQANKFELLGKLTAGMVHEIRNPLSAIKLNLDYLKLAHQELPSDINDVVSESLDAFDQINFLIQDVLDFTRKPTANFHQVTIDSITEQCLKIISMNARAKDIAIIKDLEKDSPVISINRNKAMQIFLNLLNNAIEASPEKGKVIIRTYRKDIDENNYLIWEVQDFGVGIKFEDREKISNGFFTTKKEGHGIGLGVCRMLADEIKAELDFNSEFGKGTVFSVKIQMS